MAMAKSKTLLKVRKLTKQYKNVKALDKVSFKIREGEILGLLGPNGAGKSTTIQMLLGLTTPTSGEIRYFGRDFAKHREYCLARINFTSAYTHMQMKLTVKQNLRIYSGLYSANSNSENTRELAELFGVEKLLDKPFWKLSSGQKTRVNLVKMMLNSPRLILMDEPTASLDPEIVDKVLDLITKLQKKERIAILYTSHNMKEVERICDRVIFLDKGKIVAEDTPLGFTKKVGDVSLLVTFDGDKAPVTRYLEEKNLKYKYIRKHLVEIRLAEEMVPKVLFGLSNRKVWVTNIDINKPSLDDVFLTIAKGENNGFKKS